MCAHVTRIKKTEAINLRERKGIKKGVEGRKGRGKKMCNYFIVSRKFF